MISYSDYKLLLKEADAPTAPAGAPPAAGSGTPPAPPPDLGAPPPGFGGGPPMGSSGGPPDMGGLGGLGGGPPAGSAAGLKPSGLKSSNIWDVLEKLVGNDSQKSSEKSSKKIDKTSGI